MTGLASPQTELIRLGLRLFVKRGSRSETLEQARSRFRTMEAIVPGPPRGTITKSVDAGGVEAVCIKTPKSFADRYVLFLHGGAYRVGSPGMYRHFTWRVASAARACVLAINYRLAPEHPFPAALDDAVTSYRWLLTGGCNPDQLIVMGDSAGGGLALALLLKLRDEGVPTPAAAVSLSPWTDLALTGESLTRNARADPMLNTDMFLEFATDYLAGADPRNPYASPLYGELSGLPPTLIQVGSDEVLRDDAVRMAERMRLAGCEADLQVWPRMPHVWHLLAPILPEAREAIAAIGTFVNRRLPEL